KAVPNAFVWGTLFRDPDHLCEYRLAVMRRFLADYEAGRDEGRYVVAALPRLPFADGRFSLALVSHLLFLSSAQLCLEFHIASIEELLRVAHEVRICSLQGLDCRESPHLAPVLEYLASRGHRAAVERTNYEFQKGGNKMLRVRGSEDP